MKMKLEKTYEEKKEVEKLHKENEGLRQENRRLRRRLRSRSDNWLDVLLGGF